MKDVPPEVTDGGDIDESVFLRVVEDGSECRMRVPDFRGYLLNVDNFGMNKTIDRRWNHVHRGAQP